MTQIIQKEFNNVIVMRNQNYKWGVIDKDGKEIVPFGKYGWIDDFDHGLARVRTHGEIGYYPGITQITIIGPNQTEIVDKNAIAEHIQKLRNKNPDAYAKWGIINQYGEEVLPLEYDRIWKFAGKHKVFTKAEKNGQIRLISLDALRHSEHTRKDIDLMARENTSLNIDTHYCSQPSPHAAINSTDVNNEDNSYDEVYDDNEIDYGYYNDNTYSEYAGTYAHDIAGYSDEEINIIFDGDPEAYWNID